MTRQQELELLAEWLGLDVCADACHQDDGVFLGKGNGDLRKWNPLTNDTDFLNMVAGRVDFEWHDDIDCVIASIGDILDAQNYDGSKLAAMKHATYQVCLMAAGDGKGSCTT